VRSWRLCLLLVFMTKRCGYYLKASKGWDDRDRLRVGFAYTCRFFFSFFFIFSLRFVLRLCCIAVPLFCLFSYVNVEDIMSSLNSCHGTRRAEGDNPSRTSKPARARRHIDGR